MATIEENKARFLSLCADVTRDGVENLLSWLESSDFYTAPASTRFHGDWEGGLLEHSLNVYDELVRLLAAYPEIEVPHESVVIAALFHDLCKVNFYGTELRNRKNDAGQWERYTAYNVQEKFCFGGHGSKSCFILQQFIRLTPEEGVAINCHMGAWSENAKDVSKAYEHHPFAWMLHVADEASTYLREGKE